MHVTSSLSLFLVYMRDRQSAGRGPSALVTSRRRGIHEQPHGLDLDLTMLIKNFFSGRM
jgi:hypothetical protein